ncbi:sulfatase-like hydrolase/transferase [Yinghuangia soli]|uniref:Sulfatase-like hydrolase/transferase n=1 Tax=Yinghuangia soli TaxID=2908204 RepID=A0AA41PZE2_9ACTN|nr:sulfatase-like hydrolase/transferase [Yinghuangia soli]MCF2528743.1 sulfatase-like hydrolase/transferase [Yinghuangia soli]
MSPHDPRPNILWVVSEDCPPRFGCYGDPHAATPHVDELAARGTLFEHAYSAAPVCAPSRYALLTGLAPESNGPAHHMRAEARHPAGMPTYPEVIRGLGYYCTNNAKTDYNCDIDPQAVWDDSSPAAHWRNRPEGAPFLAVFNYDATHESAVFGGGDSPVPPEAVRVPEYLPDTPEVRQDIAGYYAQIAGFDAFLGSLLAQLEEDGLRGDTVVLHTSDHGGVNPRSKRWCYNEGLHVPLIVSAPERFAHLLPPPGTRVAAAVGTIRIPPTLIDLAGGAVPGHMQGTSLLRTGFDAAGELAFGMRNRMDARYDMVRTVRDARYRYIRNYTPHRPYGMHQAFAWLAAGYRSWEAEHLAGRLDATRSAFWQAKPGVELYDTVADPDQVRNLAGDPAYEDVERRLAGALRAHMLEVHDNGFLPEGAPAEGHAASRVPGAYPLERILAVADAVPRQDPADLPLLTAALADADATVRRWAAIGILALGSKALDAVPVLRPLLGSGDAPGSEADPFVRIPCAEALARYAGDEDAVAELARRAGPENPRPVRLEALDALTALPLDRVGRFRDVVAAAAEGDEYVGAAARYLLFRLDGTYTPDTVVFDMDAMIKAWAAAQARPQEEPESPEA